MCRLPRGPLSCLFNACANTLSLISGLFLCLTITRAHANARRRVSVLNSVSSESTFTSSKQLSSGNHPNHLIKPSVLAACLLLTATPSFDTEPTAEQLIHTLYFLVLFLHLYSPEGSYCSAWLFTSKKKSVLANTMLLGTVQNSSSAPDHTRTPQGWWYNANWNVTLSLSFCSCDSRLIYRALLCHLPRPGDASFSREADVSLIQSKISYC